jgi:hypothetical protein
VRDLNGTNDCATIFRAIIWLGAGHGDRNPVYGERSWLHAKDIILARRCRLIKYRISLRGKLPLRFEPPEDLSNFVGQSQEIPALQKSLYILEPNNKLTRGCAFLIPSLTRECSARYD